MAERTYGVGIIGFGFMGRTHTYAYRNLPFYYAEPPIETRMVGVCVRRPETIDEAVRLGGFERAVTDWRKLIERDDIDIIHVCTPNALHKPAVIRWQINAVHQVGAVATVGDDWLRPVPLHQLTLNV